MLLHGRLALVRGEHALAAASAHEVLDLRGSAESLAEARALLEAVPVVV